MTLEWQGKKVTKKLRNAQIRGVNKTMASAVTHAKNNHEWNNRTGILEGSIKTVEPAKASSNGVRGVWGSADVAYALIHELGGVIEPKNANALAFRADDGSFVVTQKVTIPERPALRPAADAKYPELVKNIRQSYERAA